MTECDIKFLKYCGYDDNQIQHIDDVWDYKKEESYEMWKEGSDAATKELQEKIRKLVEMRQKDDCIIKAFTEKMLKLEKQIVKMKSDVRELITDRMNDDLDQNIIEDLFEKWELEE